MAHKEEIHSCKENHDKDVEIRHEKINQEEWSWVLVQTWHRTEREIELGFAFQDGSIISTHTVLIAYCPFCGMCLTHRQENTW